MAPTAPSLPGVLSFQRCVVISDGLFWNLFPDGSRTPLHVVRHGIRGTQSVANTGSKSSGATVKSSGRDVNNIQTTDTAKLDPSASALLITFAIRFLDVRDALFACAPGKEQDAAVVGEMRANFADFTEKAIAAGALRQLALRYARNLLNGRFAWRNRSAAAAMQVRVLGDGGTELLAESDAFAIPLNQFDSPTPAEEALAVRIAAGLVGAEKKSATLLVEATIEFGSGGVEVFPSQNYLEDKAKGFARPLYTVGRPEKSEIPHTTQRLGQAALRDQKLNNAIRTIDTWYEEYPTIGRPIPVEPNGANLTEQRFLRDSKKASGFEILKRISSVEPSSEEGLFLLACFVRGGVFSGGDK